MKLHRIETTNLNSLYGTQSVDLDATLAGASLFLIFGPTGSGKSTLMDAVSLALFGMTPRLNDKQGDPTADPRAIMSRGTGECSATVVFSKLEERGRQTYRAVWSCQRARKNPRGNPQRSVRSLEQRAADGSWTLLVSDWRDKVLVPVFERVLEGFGVNDFNRSMLLAQGQFDSFLGAQPDERAGILERLTDTSIYQQLGARAARINRGHSTRLAALRTLAGAGGGLDAEALAQLEAEHDRHGAELTRRMADHERAIGGLTWHDGATELRSKLTQAEAEQSELLREAHEATALLEQLATHEHCEEHLAFRHLDAFRAAQEQAARLRAQLATLDDSVPRLEEGVRRGEQTVAAAAASEHHAAEQLELLRPLALAANKAAAEHATSIERADETSAQHCAADARLSEAQLEHASATDALVEAIRMAEVARAELEAQAAGLDTACSPAQQIADAAGRTLSSLLGPVDFEAARRAAAQEVEGERGRCGLLRAAQSPVHAARSAAASVTALRAQRELLASRLVAARADWDEVARDLAHQAALESQADAALTRTKVVAGLVGHRIALEDGVPCPLCGSEAHPWSHDPKQRAADAAIAETVAAAQRARDDARQAHEEAVQRHHGAEGAARELTAQLDLLRDQERAATQQQLDLDQAATAALEAITLPVESSDADVEQLLGQATRRLEEAVKLLTALDDARRQLDEAERQLREMLEGRQRLLEDRRAKSAEAAIALEGKEALRAEREARRDELAALLVQQEAERDAKRAVAVQAQATWCDAWRVAVAGDKARPMDALPPAECPPDTLLEAQKAWVEKTKSAAKKAVTEHQQGLDEQKDARARRAALADQSAEVDATRKQARELLDATLAALALGNEEELRTLRLDDQRLGDCRKRRKELEDRRLEVVTRILERRALVDAHARVRPQGLLEEAKRETLEEAVGQASLLREAAARAYQASGDQLRDHQRAVQEREENRSKLRDAEQQARVWQTLHDYIGVNDGGRFKQFAQALNLRQLLDKANVHLARLSSRYQLVPRLDGGLPTLELDLSDLWQAGERVAPRSLSGGERFLVSLALALGLSDFRKVRMPIETLLLDEGFGTLDAETLSVALGALSQLQADGRQVGIISHVVGLRDRIEARIEVRPLGAGRSRVSTPT